MIALLMLFILFVFAVIAFFILGWTFILIRAGVALVRNRLGLPTNPAWGLDISKGWIK